MRRAALKLVVLLLAFAVFGSARQASAQVVPGGSTGGVVVSRSPEDAGPAPAVAATRSAPWLELSSLRIWWTQLVSAPARTSSQAALKARRPSLKNHVFRVP